MRLSTDTVVPTIGAARMRAEGYAFHRAGNAAWLTNAVPARDIGFPTGAR